MAETITIYDERGRTKLPKKIMEWLGAKKGDKILAVNLRDEAAVKLIPLEKAMSTVDWPRLKGVDEKTALEKRTEALYESL
jgi:bifunctional DNA-binding transcriptional regulator/antitoxin component of YhaV-PrlF toxin-antitoxin module